MTIRQHTPPSRRPPAAPPPPLVTSFVTRSDLANIFRTTPLRITKWTAAGMPVAERGGRGREHKYSLPAVVEWRIRTELERRGGGVPPGTVPATPMDLAFERAKLARAQTRKTELDVRKREGELLEVAEVSKAWSGIVVAIRSKLLAMPKALAARCAQATDESTAESVLTGEVRDILRELAGWTPPAEASPAMAEGA